GARVRLSKEQQSDPALRNYDGADVVQGRIIRREEAGAVGGLNRFNRIDEGAYKAYLKTLSPWNRFGAWMVAFWLGLLFLLILGSGYAYFWTASTIIYLLLRKSVDSAEMDEVSLEEDDYEASFPPPAGAAPSGAPPQTAVKPATSLPIVEPL